MAILKGDPYGKSEAEVLRNIKSGILIIDGFEKDASCISDFKKKPVWTFHVVVPKSERSPDGIDGHLALNARTGKMECGGLPFLD